MSAGDDADEPSDAFAWRKVVVAVVVWTLIAGGPAVYYGWKWLAFDEPNVDLICSDGTTGCSSGESNNKVTAILFAAMWLAPFLIVGLIVLWALRLRGQQRRESGQLDR